MPPPTPRSSSSSFRGLTNYGVLGSGGLKLFLFGGGELSFSAARPLLAACRVVAIMSDNLSMVQPTRFSAAAAASATAAVTTINGHVKMVVSQIYSIGRRDALMRTQRCWLPFLLLLLLLLLIDGPSDCCGVRPVRIRAIHLYLFIQRRLNGFFGWSDKVRHQ